MNNIIKMSGVKDEDVIERLHTCDCCGDKFAWGKDSWWYGDLDEAECIKMCSAECKTKLGDPPRLPTLKGEL